MKIKHPKLKVLKKRAWKLISEYVRRINADENGMTFCFTCGKKFHWKKLDCGHYIHKDCLDFDLINLAPQCTFCNRYKHGNLGIYAERLFAEYGEDTIIELRQRANQVRKFTQEDLEGMISIYKQVLTTLSKP